MAGVLVASVLLVSAPAGADPHPLPFSYPYATLPAGMTEVEQYVDLTPVRAGNVGDSGTPITLGSVLVTELEYGLTDRLELGLYFQFLTDPTAGGDGPLHFDGIKQRLRYRFVDAGVWPVNLALYGEIAEMTDEIELEAKILLERRLGRFQVIANLWGEREIGYNGARAWVANPTGGVSYEIVPAFHVGVEYWMHGELGVAEVPGVPKDFNAAFHHYVGPAFLLQSTRVWWAVAPYVRLDAPDRAGQAGDAFGRFWIRSIIGIDL